MITPSSHSVLMYLLKHRGTAFTYDEVAQATGYKPSTVQQVSATMAKNSVIHRYIGDESHTISVPHNPDGLVIKFKLTPVYRGVHFEQLWVNKDYAARHQRDSVLWIKLDVGNTLSLEAERVRSGWSPSSYTLTLDGMNTCCNSESLCKVYENADVNTCIRLVYQVLAKWSTPPQVITQTEAGETDMRRRIKESPVVSF